MKYCSDCGDPIVMKVPEGDDRERHCCDSCGAIHYFNPRIIVACIPRWEGKIMLCKRGIEPRHGYWTVPGGFMELDETTEQGAMRETWEETHAKVNITRLHGMYNIPQIGQVYVVYLADMISPEFEVTPESTEIRLFDPSDIPWDSIAFNVIEKSLRQYVEGVSTGDESFHRDTIRFTRK
jgi:ADP-ribose pyrophosphatase YjhB (NUDIX family)